MTTRLTSSRLFYPVHLTRGRMAFALTMAVVADGLQILLQAVPFAPQAIDVAAAVVVSAALGFHVLFLPTFVIEAIPVVNDFPTWIGCVATVIALRRRQERSKALSE